MGQLVFQATLGGQVNLVGPNTASTFNINVPATSGNMVTTGDTGTVTATMLASTTGSGAVVLATSPTLVAPALGTPSALVGTNITGTAAGLSIGGNAATATTATNVSGGTSSVTSETVSGNLTLSGGTANGVAYLNGSKVVTTGSALVFDGANLGIGTSSPFADSGYRSIDIRGTTGGEINLGTASNNYGQILADATNGLLLNTLGATAPIKFFVGGAEQMRVNNTGLGIGTSSPAYKLDVNGAIRGLGGVNAIRLENSANTGVYARFSRPNKSYILALDINNNGGTDFSLYDETAAATRWTVDSSGNLGIGTSSPNASAILDAQSTTKGVRMPNMTTTQKNAISSPAAGLMVFDTTLAKLCVYTGAAWQTITST